MSDLLGFHPVVLFEKHILSGNPVEKHSYDIVFLETGVAQGMIFEAKQTAKSHVFTIDVDTEFENIEKFRGGFLWRGKNGGFSKFFDKSTGNLFDDTTLKEIVIDSSKIQASERIFFGQLPLEHIFR